MSIRNRRRFLLRRRAAETISGVTTYPGAPVEAIKMSISGRVSGNRSNGTATPPNSEAIASALAVVRFAIRMRPTPCRSRWRAASSDISPAPISRIVFPWSPPKIFFASSTAA